MMKKIIRLLLLLTLVPSLSLATNQEQTTVNAKTEYVKNYSYQKKSKKLATKNAKLKKSIASLQEKIAANQKFIDEHTNKTTQTAANTDLANLDYSGTQEIIINNNNPNFTQADLSTVNGAWQEYGDLDNLNRVTAANAMLNVSLMQPKSLPTS